MHRFISYKVDNAPNTYVCTMILFLLAIIVLLLTFQIHRHLVHWIHISLSFCIKFVTIEGRRPAIVANTHELRFEAISIPNNKSILMKLTLMTHFFLCLFCWVLCDTMVCLLRGNTMTIQS